jgi:peroxisome-assembly ATPase
MLTVHKLPLKGLFSPGRVWRSPSSDQSSSGESSKSQRGWHLNTFMLETFARLEQLRQSRYQRGAPEVEPEHSLIWLAKHMIETSPILFLDEFQLPDRTASKILSNLFTAFFQLGGVLIATSNRMPDEFAKASGMDFAAPPRGGPVRNWLGSGAGRGLFPANNEYAAFVDVLKARCEIWSMEGGRDWRRREAEEMEVEAAEITKAMREEMIGGFANMQERGTAIELDHDTTKFDEVSSFGGARQQLDSSPEEMSIIKGVTPKKYILASPESEEIWRTAIRTSLPDGTPEQIPWESTTLLVYGRTIPVERHLEGVTYWTFQDLCGATFDSADYITLTSAFHIIIMDEVPILTLLQKNEARRLITMLDALYEARCKLLIRADTDPGDLFSPETNKAGLPGTILSRAGNVGGDVVYLEALSEIY